MVALIRILNGPRALAIGRSQIPGIKEPSKSPDQQAFASAMTKGMLVCTPVPVGRFKELTTTGVDLAELPPSLVTQLL
jgi:hypothetical protein